MKIKLATIWDSMRSSYWFAPALMAMGAILLAAITLTIDSRFKASGVPETAWVFYAGDFLVRGDIVVLLPSTTSRISDLAREVNSALVVGVDRTHEQDIEFPINQLVQLAVRALSPAINDPITAIMAIEQLRAGLCYVGERNVLSSVILDAQGTQRLFVKRQDAAHNVEAAFSLIRQYGRENLEVTISLLDAIEQVSRRTTDEAFRGALLHQATLIGHGAQSALPEEADRKQVAERFQRVIAVFEAV